MSAMVKDRKSAPKAAGRRATTEPNAAMRTDPVEQRHADPVATTLSAAASVARYVELREVRLVRVDAQMLADADDILKMDVDVRIGKPVHSFVFNEARNVLNVYVHVDVRLGAGESQSSEPEHDLVRISVAFGLSYQMTVAPPPEDIRATLFSAFAEINGTYNGWPYLREYVQAVTSRMGLLPITLPVYRVPKPAPVLNPNSSLGSKSTDASSPAIDPDVGKDKQ